MKLITIFLLLLAALNLHALTVGEIPKEVSLSGDNGGLASNGELWSSSSLKDKIFVMFYVDPDEKGVNEHYSKALKAKKYNKNNFASIAIVNLDATWKPNFIIESLLKSKQEEFPNTLYVKDKNRVLVKEWEVGDDASNVLVFSKMGKLLFYKSGAMSEEDMQKSFKIIEENL